MEKIFSVNEAFELIKSLIESGSIKVSGPHSGSMNVSHAEKDAEYLKTLFARLTSEKPSDK